MEMDLEYFRSEGHKIIFAVMELDGIYRARLLGLDQRHSASQKLCEERFRKLKQTVRDCPHPYAANALLRLEGIERFMTNRRRTFYPTPSVTVGQN